MNRWKPFQRFRQFSSERAQDVYCTLWKSMTGLVIVCSCLYILGCSASPEPVSGPSKQDIQTDADRFFEKMEQEKLRKSATQH